MPRIADLLQPSIKNKIIDFTVKVGDVFRMKLSEEEGVTPKNKGDGGRNKYFIIMGKDESGDLLALVLINTKVNEGLPKLKKTSICLLAHLNIPFLG